jgi:hypothetical protein
MVNKEFINIEPNIWGLTFWKMIYYIILTYDSTDKHCQQCVEMFFFSLGGLLPCSTCQEHYQNYFSKNPIKNVIQDKIKLLKWVYNLQTKIEIRNSKKTKPFDLWLKEIEKNIN